MGNRAGSDRSTQVKKIELCMVQFIASPQKKMMNIIENNHKWGSVV